MAESNKTPINSGQEQYPFPYKTPLQDKVTQLKSIYGMNRTPGSYYETVRPGAAKFNRDLVRTPQSQPRGPYPGGPSPDPAPYWDMGYTLADYIEFTY